MTTYKINNFKKTNNMETTNVTVLGNVQNNGLTNDVTILAQIYFDELLEIISSEGDSLLDFSVKTENLIRSFLLKLTSGNNTSKLKPEEQIREICPELDSDVSKTIGYLRAVKKLYYFLGFRKTVTNENLDRMAVLQSVSKAIGHICQVSIPVYVSDYFKKLRPEYDLRYSLQKLNSNIQEKTIQINIRKYKKIRLTSYVMFTMSILVFVISAFI